ncbi:porin, partial [Shewanella sp.]|uniref:porin n=1 Tax=Shewanella sp. TaxID=50422 RepID=UPI0040486D98
ASAQVSITGKVGAGYATKTTNAATPAAEVTTKGMLMTNSDITFSATEDLGAGMSVKATVGIDGVNSNNAITGNNGSLALSGGFGTATFTAGEESCNGVVGSAAGVDLEDIGIGLACSSTATSSSDSLSFALPAMNGLTIKVTTLEGAAGAGNNSAPSTNYLFLDYASGPLTAGVNFTNIYQASTRTRTNIKYDLGMVKLGFGYSTGGVAAGATNNQTVFGAQFPMGAMTLSVGTATVSTGTATKKSATGVGIDYSMSKRTGIEARYTTGNAQADYKRDVSIKLVTTF